MRKASSRSEAVSRKPKESPADVRPSKVTPGGPQDKARTGSARASREQSACFEKGASLFHARDFRAAKEHFEKATSGPMPEVAHAARSYIRMCEQRVRARAPSPVSAEDHYNYAVALINEHAFVEADRHLQEAVAMAPDGDHLYYALALCRGMQGNLQEAYDNLKRAIEINPRNRAQARSDPDFADLIRQRPLEELVFPERVR